MTPGSEIGSRSTRRSPRTPPAPWPTCVPRRWTSPGQDRTVRQLRRPQHAADQLRERRRPSLPAVASPPRSACCSRGPATASATRCIASASRIPGETLLGSTRTPRRRGALAHGDRRRRRRSRRRHGDGRRALLHRHAEDPRRPARRQAAAVGRGQGRHPRGPAPPDREGRRRADLRVPRPGVSPRSNATHRFTITNMGAELGATTSIFPSDEQTAWFMSAQGRPDDFTSRSSRRGRDLRRARRDRSRHARADDRVPPLARQREEGARGRGAPRCAGVDRLVHQLELRRPHRRRADAEGQAGRQRPLAHRHARVQAGLRDDRARRVALRPHRFRRPHPRVVVRSIRERPVAALRRRLRCARSPQLGGRSGTQGRSGLPC